MSSSANQRTLKDFMMMTSKKKNDVYDVTSGSDEEVRPSPPKKVKAKIEDIYQKKTQLEHILLRPDTYIGSVETVTDLMWVISDGKMVQKNITYVPGLYKIFDEILVNAADNKQRDKNMNTIKIDISPEDNKISIWNNGQGIPVVQHEKEKMMVPTMIFGHLLTSSNFNDDEKKVTGGRNGYGAKLCNVFSTEFTVETATKQYKRAFKQTWKDNMSSTVEPKIRDFFGDDYTKISFKPDLAKFKMDTLNEDIVALFSRRAYDIAASGKGVKVFLNGTKVPVKGFKDYVDLFLKDKTDEVGQPLKFIYESCGDRWEIACAPSENGFMQNSFVNSIATTKGGRHVDYIADMVVKNLVETIKKKNKGGIDIKPFQVRNHMWIFINCLIENPTFDSQTKENMTLQAKSFGSKCAPSEKFYNSVVKSGIVESVLQWAKFKEQKLLDKGSGKKSSKIKGIPKLEDANDAGSRNSSQCTLILTEGDSAKTLAVAGLGVIGRDRYGVFPLRGKLLNVREASHKQIMENAEITALVKIIGLKYKEKYDSYDDLKTLRYGKVMIMTDQDHDGSHIKGLIINFVHTNWPSLLKLGFLEQFITPIVKASRGNEVISFFSTPELEEWKKNKANWRAYKIKYYKGLGTSTSKEAKEYFSDMARHRIKFKYQGKTDDDQIMMAFSKKHVEDRKVWLTNWMEGVKRRNELGEAEDILYDKDVQAITYSEFVNKELVLFSNLDNERSIPSLVDGLKPGQRKVLFTCFKRNDKREIKVAQLAGSVAEHSAYHHGEASLMSTIVNLAQNYVGSNNINLLQPIGQFGTRLQGGKDSASPRYIFTMLSPLARTIFNPHDDAILKSLYDDHQKIEPEWYCPIIPMVLVNGAEGIGTGWSTKAPNYNPREIVENLFRLLRNEELLPMKPWYKGFTGDITELTPVKFVVNGVVSVLNEEKFEITELPIATWTQSYKENVMEPMLNGTEKITPLIADYKEYHTDTTVKFVVSVKRQDMEKYEQAGFHSTFKLQSLINLTSMVLFDQNGCLKKYESPLEIMKEFYKLRLDLYEKRREYMLGILTAEASKLSNQARFISEKCDGKLTVENKKKKLMVEELKKRGYDSDPVKAWKVAETARTNRQQDDEPVAGDSEEVEEAEEGKDYDYLLNMPIVSLTLERKEELLKKRDEKNKELNTLKSKTPKDIYTEDLKVFLVQLDKVEKEEEEDSKETKKKVVTKKNFSKKALLDVAPSPMGRKVAPRLEEVMKKVELATKAKSKEKKPRAKKEDIPKVKYDKYDAMAADQSSLIDILNTSDEIEGIDSSKDKKAMNGDSTNGDSEKKKRGGPKGPRGPRKSKEPKDGMKQTKLTFGKAEKKLAEKKSPAKRQKKKKNSSDDDFGGSSDSDIGFKPKKKKGRGLLDSDDEFVVSSPEKVMKGAAAGDRQRREKAAPAKYTFSDDSEGGFSSE